MGKGESQTSAFESLLRQVALAPGYDRDELEALEPGTLIAGRFEIGDELGAGGFARVYRALDQVLSRPVAIKVLRRSRRLSDRELELFYREAQATARLNHPNIVTAYDWGEWNGRPFLVLELLDGEPLSERLPAASESAALEVVAVIAEALEYAHARGVLHLDLKAQNIIVLDNGALKILDFGLAGIEWDEEVPGGQRVDGGTPATMAPEQRLDGDVDGRADIWATGVILHQLLFGSLPPRQVAVTGELEATAPRRSAAILARTLAPSPGRRYPDAAALKAAIEQAASRRGRATRVEVVAAVLAAVAASIVAIGLGRDDGPLPLSVTPPPLHRQLTFRGDVHQADLSADGRRIVFLSNNDRELWIKAVDGDRPAERLFSREQLGGPRFLPDDRRVIVAVIGNPRSNWLIDTETGEAERSPLPPSTYAVGFKDELVSGSLAYNYISIAPISGGPPERIELPATKWIYDIDADPSGSVLVSTFDQRGHLVELGPTSRPREIHSEPELISSARWAPDGGVYYLVSPGAFAEIKYLGPGGGSPVTIISGLELDARLDVSASGRRLIYHRAQALRTIERVRAGEAPEPITPATAEVTGAAISGDNLRLAFTLREGVRHSLQIYDLASREVERVDCRDPCASPAWSPDRSKVALRIRRAGSWGLAIVDLATGSARDVPGVRASHEVRVGLTWLSERELLYMPPYNEALRVVDLPSGRDRPFLAGPPRPGWMFGPTVSSDGQRVAFFWNNRGERGVYIADRDGRGATKITGDWHPVRFTDGDRRLVVESSTTERVVAAGSIPIDGGEVDIGWRASPAEAVDMLLSIDGLADLLVIRSEQRADVWLLENPGP